jgi:Tfp pilus assembly protein PilF
MMTPTTLVADSPRELSAGPLPASSNVSGTLLEKRLALVLGVILFVATVILYSPTFSNGFVNFDDPAYVTRNAHVLNGLSWNNIVWAFRSTVEANWHPLTWISHMVDVQLFGLNPKWHHVDSALLHALNVVLLFLVLRSATKNMLRSTVVAALFAVHPLNVEAVAWVAERKSLLCMFFLLLSLLAYGWYVRERSVGRYAVLFFLFALALAAKPMAITFPLLLLLWDYWPLYSGVPKSETSAASRTVYQLSAEKIPLFVLSAASAITIYAGHHGGALGTTGALPLRLRIENAVFSYAAYIGKAIWPTGLAVFYPHPEYSLAPWKVVGASLLLCGISAVIWHYRERRYLLSGWLWFLVSLVPVIGIVQVGRQGMADRYAYFSFIGLFVIAVWGGSEVFVRVKLSRLAVTALTLSILVAYASATYVQTQYWRNSYSLFTHALEDTSRNGVAEDNLGAALMEAGRPDLAGPHLEAATVYIPELSTAHYNLGLLLQQQTRLDLAKREYELALTYSTDETELAQTRSNLGFLFVQQNELKPAVEQFTAALQINPAKQNALLGRGLARYRQGELDAALNDFSSAVQIGPMAPAEFWLGRALEDKGRLQEASSHYQAALQLAPDMAEAQQRLDAIRAKAH